MHQPCRTQSCCPHSLGDSPPTLAPRTGRSFAITLPYYSIFFHHRVISHSAQESWYLVITPFLYRSYLFEASAPRNLNSFHPSEVQHLHMGELASQGSSYCRSFPTFPVVYQILVFRKHTKYCSCP